MIAFDNRDCGLSGAIRVRKRPNLLLADRRGVAHGCRCARRTRSTTWPPTPSACSTRWESARAHVVGASMGGMIAQVVAAASPAARAEPHLDHVVERQPTVSQARPAREQALLSRPSRPGRSRERDPASDRRLRRHRQPGRIPTDHGGAAPAHRAQRAPRLLPCGRCAPAARDHRLRRSAPAAARKSPRRRW